jgi:hypothetical protein
MSAMDRRRFVIRFLSLFSPFVLCIFADYFIVGRRYYDMVSDEAPHFWFGHGLAWLEGGVLPLQMHMSHLPSIPYNELGALAAWGVRHEADPFAAMAAVGLGLALVIAAAASLWATFLSDKFELSPLALSAVSSLIATQPPLLLFPWSSYYVLGCLLLPLGFGIASILERRELNDPSAIAVPYVLGFATTVHYTAVEVVIAATIVLAISFPADWRPSLKSWSGSKLVWPEPIIIAASILFLAISFVLGIIYSPARFWVLTSLAWAGVVGFALFCTYRFSFPLALWALRISVGWLIGANVLYPFWLPRFWGSMVTSGALPRPDVNLLSVLFSAKGAAALTSSPWRCLVWMMAAMAGALILSRLLGIRNRGSADLGPLNLFVLVVVAIAAAAARDGLLYDPLLLRFDRYLVAVTVAVPVAFLVAIRMWPAQAQRLAATAVGFAGVAYLHYAVAVGPTVAEARALDDKVTEIIERFLSEHQDGEVVCYHTYTPHQCSRAFGYEWYHYLTGNEADSRQGNARREYNVPMLGCDNPQMCLGSSGRARAPRLLVGQGMPTFLKSLGTLQFEYTSLIEPSTEGHGLEVIAIPASDADR